MKVSGIALIILLLETAYNIFRTIENYYEYEHLFLAAINLILFVMFALGK